MALTCAVREWFGLKSIKPLWSAFLRKPTFFPFVDLSPPTELISTTCPKEVIFKPCFTHGIRNISLRVSDFLLSETSKCYTDYIYYSYLRKNLFSWPQLTCWEPSRQITFQWGTCKGDFLECCQQMYFSCPDFQISPVILSKDKSHPGQPICND